jgi:hypothetical protein
VPKLPADIEGTPLARLNERQLAAAGMIAGGMSYSAAFKAAGFPEASYQTRASEHKNKAKFAHFRDAVRWLIDTRLHSVAAKAVSTLEEALSDPKGDVRVRAALALLDRTGFSAVRQVEITHRDERSEAELLRSIRSSLGMLDDETREKILLGINKGMRAEIDAVDAEFSEISLESKR